MHTLLESVSQALSTHDADALEQLAGEAQRCSAADAMDILHVRNMAEVISQQLRAAEIHLGIAASSRYGKDAWER